MSKASEWAARWNAARSEALAADDAQPKYHLHLGFIAAHADDRVRMDLKGDDFTYAEMADLGRWLVATFGDAPAPEGSAT